MVAATQDSGVELFQFQEEAFVAVGKLSSTNATEIAISSDGSTIVVSGRDSNVVRKPRFRANYA